MLSLGKAALILPCLTKADTTDVTESLNGMIQTSGDGCVYCGGRGVVIRNPFDDYQDDVRKSVVPATFWVNDITVPSQIYPDYDWNEPAGLAGAAYRASVAFVIGNEVGKLLWDVENVQSDDWGWGVFYATDSNCVDMRCRYRYDLNGWDCPGAWVDADNGMFWDDGSGDTHLGAGWYSQGNPYADGGGGGGTGPHWAGEGFLNQENAEDGNGVALTMDYDSQCNYDLKGNGWADWVDHWIANDPHDGGGMASVDRIGCWVNNIRDLVNLQNALYRIYGWQVIGGTPPVEYWGWNEIPFDRNTLGDPMNWDAVVIHLPAEICNPGGDDDSVNCLHPDSHARLESTLDKWVDKGYLVPGLENIAFRPGSYVVFVREFWRDDGSEAGNWFKYFFCESWAYGKYEIYSWGQDWGDGGGCALQWASGAKMGNSNIRSSHNSTDSGMAMLV